MTGGPGAPLPLPLPEPALADGDLVLRPWRTLDAGALAAAWADPEIVRWTGVPDPSDVTAARRWIRGDERRRSRGLSLDLVIDLQGEVAGEVGMTSVDTGTRSAEIGWWVAPERRGSGLATAAARLFAGWAIEELALATVLARCHLDNPASGAVARAAGFEPVGRDGSLEVWQFAWPVGEGRPAASI